MIDYGIVVLRVRDLRSTVIWKTNHRVLVHCLFLVFFMDTQGQSLVFAKKKKIYYCIVVLIVIDLRSMVICNTSHRLLVILSISCLYFWWIPGANPMLSVITLDANYVFVVSLSDLRSTTICNGSHKIPAHHLFFFLLFDGCKGSAPVL